MRGILCPFSSSTLRPPSVPEPRFFTSTYSAFALLLTPEIEPRVYALIQSKAQHLAATVYALNGMTDHVHLIVSIPPKVAVATFIGQIKGVASTRLNQSHGGVHRFAWQDEYGVFSFDKKHLPHHVAYVERQKEHHAQGTIIPLLERTGDPAI